MKDTPGLKKYDLTILRLIDIITNMTLEERGLFLNEMESRAKKIKLRATRKQCDIPIEFVNAMGKHTAVVTNISFTGAFVRCRVPVLIDEKIIMHFKHASTIGDCKLTAMIVHSTHQGFGAQFTRVDSTAARFIQTCMNR